MDIETAKKALPIIQAWVAGKTVQFKPFGSNDQAWVDDRTPSFNFDSFHFRIKPEKSWRPWMLTEVPVGCVFREKKMHTQNMIIGISLSKIRTSFGEMDFDGLLFTDFEWKWPQESANAWKPCGVLV